MSLAARSPATFALFAVIADPVSQRNERNDGTNFPVNSLFPREVSAMPKRRSVVPFVPSVVCEVRFGPDAEIPTSVVGVLFESSVL